MGRAIVNSEGVSDPVEIYAGKVLDVDPSTWTMIVSTTIGRRRSYAVPIDSVYTHRDEGEGIHFMPEVGTFVWLCYPSDSEKPFVVSFGRVLSDQGGDNRQNRPRMNPGDLALLTRDRNGVFIRRGGYLEILSTPIARTIYHPLDNSIMHLAENYRVETFSGSSKWEVDRPEEDPDGKVGAHLTIQSKEFADSPLYTTQVSAGRVGGDQISFQFEGDPARTPLLDRILELKVFSDEAVSSVDDLVATIDVSATKEGDVQWDIEGAVSGDVEGFSILTVGQHQEVSIGTYKDVTIGTYQHIKVPGEVPTTKDTSKVFVTKTGTSLPGSTEPVILGTQFLTDLSASITEIQTALNGLGIATPETVTLLANIATSLTAGAPHLSSTLETE